MLQKIMALGAMLAALSIPATGIWWLSGHATWANEQAKEQKTMKEAVNLLTEFRVQDETEKKTRAETIKKLCDAGKLKGADCD
jgi:hypothetical protein